MLGVVLFICVLPAIEMVVELLASTHYNQKHRAEAVETVVVVAVVTGGTGKPFSSKRSGRQGERETRKMESRVYKHRGIGATRDRTLDSVSRALVLGTLPLVLTMRPNSGRRLGVFLGIPGLASKMRRTHFSWKDFRTYAK